MPLRRPRQATWERLEEFCELKKYKKGTRLSEPVAKGFVEYVAATGKGRLDKNKNITYATLQKYVATLWMTCGDEDR